MNQSNTATVVDAQARKAQKKLLGTLSGPIPATKVYRKNQVHDFNGQQAVSWVVITGDNKMVKATTYAGNLGAKFNLGDHNTTPVPPEGTKEARQAIKGYQEAPISECPFASPVTEESAD